MDVRFNTLVRHYNFRFMCITYLVLKYIKQILTEGKERNRQLYNCAEF